MKRAIDQLGRLVIPAEYRKAIGVKNNDAVNIELRGNEIIITDAKNDDSIECIKQKLAATIKSYEMATDKDFYLGYMRALEWVLDTQNASNSRDV